MTSGLGIMQGRLSPPVDGRIQAFPGDDWPREFEIARGLGLDAIEWVVDSRAANPLWTHAGIGEIRELAASCGVRVDFICADIFLDAPFAGPLARDCHANQAALMRLVECCSELGAVAVEVPLLEGAAIHGEAGIVALCRALEPCLDLAVRNGVLVALETSLAPDAFGGLLRSLDHPAVRVTYDTGNSAALGFASADELGTYGPLIVNVHVKDRMRGGGTVALGTGDADLPAVFRDLAGCEYRGAYTLQAARGTDELGTIRRCIDNVRNWQHEAACTGAAPPAARAMRALPL